MRQTMRKSKVSGTLSNLATSPPHAPSPGLNTQDVFGVGGWADTTIDPKCLDFPSGTHRSNAGPSAYNLPSHLTFDKRSAAGNNSQEHFIVGSQPDQYGVTSQEKNMEHGYQQSLPFDTGPSIPSDCQRSSLTRCRTVPQPQLALTGLTYEQADRSHWTPSDNPQVHPDVSYQQPPPCSMTPQFGAPSRSTSWAEVADVPVLRWYANTPSLPANTNSASSGSSWYNARQPSSDYSNAGQPVYVYPALSLNMRQATPPNYAQLSSMYPPPLEEGHAGTIGNWLTEPRAVGERPALNINLATSHLAPNTMPSPAKSVAASSGRSNSRRSRRERQQWSANKCPRCDEGFLSSEDLRKHIRRVHVDHEDRPFACEHDQCQWRFIYPKDLRRHKLIHAIHPPAYSCQHPSCISKGKSFSTKWNYDRHTAAHYRADSGIQMSRSTSYGDSTSYHE